MNRSRTCRSLAFVAAAAALSALGCQGADDSGKSSGGSTPSDGGDAGGNPCGLSTKFEGDDLCILPPPADEGFQIHVGPTDYDDPTQLANFLIDPTEEPNHYYYLKAGNETDIHFYKRQYRMRPGSHHLIVSQVQEDHPDGWGSQTGTGFGLGRRLGGSQNISKDNPLNGDLPPEDADIGVPLTAHAQLSVNLHHHNTTDEPILREAWVNFWYVNDADVKEEAKEMFSVGGFLEAIQPSEQKTLHYSCPISEAGRVLTMYGHRHAHNVRFTAWRTRGTQKDVVYDGYDWAEPMVLEYSSLTQNSPPDITTHREGGWSGILDLLPGDALEWECEINNDGMNTLRFTNETVDGEMCILVGDTVGPSVACQYP